MRHLKCTFIVVAVSLLLFALVGCASDGTSVPDQNQVHIDNITSALEEEVVPFTVHVTESEGRFTLDVSVSSYSDLSEFGTCVLVVKRAFEAEFPEDARHRFSVSQAIQGKTPSLVRFSSSDYGEAQSSLSGTLSDTRSGELDMISVECLGDLAEKFPAVLLYAEEIGYTE